MDNYKEIVTKAVIGKSKKSSTDNFSITCENNATTILGCWIINHHFNGNIIGNNVNIIGSYDVNVWYSYDNDTKTAVAKETYNYIDNINVNIKEKLNDKEVIVRSLKAPTVKDVSSKDNIITLDIDKELAIEVVGDAKIKVPTQVIDDDYEDITGKASIEDIKDLDENYIK